MLVKWTPQHERRPSHPQLDVAHLELSSVDIDQRISVPRRVRDMWRYRGICSFLRGFCLTQVRQRRAEGTHLVFYIHLATTGWSYRLSLTPFASPSSRLLFRVSVELTLGTLKGLQSEYCDDGQPGSLQAREDGLRVFTSQLESLLAETQGPKTTSVMRIRHRSAQVIRNHGPHFTTGPLKRN